MEKERERAGEREIERDREREGERERERERGGERITHLCLILPSLIRFLPSQVLPLSP